MRAVAPSVRFFTKGKALNKLLLRMNCCLEHDLVLHLFFRCACMLSENSPNL